MIGEGSFGKVMMVKKKDSGEIFAMKVLNKEKLREKDQQLHTKSIYRNIIIYIF